MKQVTLRTPIDPAKEILLELARILARRPEKPSQLSSDLLACMLVDKAMADVTDRHPHHVKALSEVGKFVRTAVMKH